jgi:regulator of ribonuclease activity A
MTVKTTDLCDQYSNEIQAIGAEFQSFGRKKSFSGPIKTVKVFEDNVLVKEALETIPAGSVLVVDGGGSKRQALLGDQLAGIAENRGLAGIIINGCVRDCEELSQINVGILALGTHPLKSKKEGKGEKNITLSFLSLDWNPDDYLYADQDGIVISTRDLTK